MSGRQWRCGHGRHANTKGLQQTGVPPQPGPLGTEVFTLLFNLGLELLLRPPCGGTSWRLRCLPRL